MSSMPALLPDKIAVPTDPYWQYLLNFAIQIASIALYGVLLVFLLHNTYKYLWLKQRYKVMTHTMFYSFALLLAVGRIY